MKQNAFLKHTTAIMGCMLLVALLGISDSYAQKYTAQQITQGQTAVPVSTFTLNNGLTVILSPDHTRPQIMGGVVVKAGNKNDPADQTGIAHYLEHMLFKGTKQMGSVDYQKEEPFLNEIYSLYEALGKEKDPEARKDIQKKINENSLKAGEFAILNEMDNLLRSIGSSGINAFTSDEITFYFNQFPPNQFEKWAELYSHRFMEPVFRAFQSELEVVFEEKNMYNDNFITGLLESFMSHMYKKHPYGQQTTLGSIDHIRNPSLNKMYEFYHTYYVANNMALILVGDFNVNEIKPIIEQKFGQWKSATVPAFPKYEETDFNGRELVKVKMSPIKVGLIGFRTVPNNHPDEAALDVCNRILSNNGQTGLFDKLVADNKIMMAMMMPVINNDYGHSILLYIPKIIGQSHSKAENLVMAQLEELKKGNFDNELLEAVKNDIYIEYITNLEDYSNRAVLFAQAFTQNRTMEDYLMYHEKIKRISHEEVIRVANKYYGPNYLVFQSSMGFPKKEKLEKPGYEPVKPSSGQKSAFAKHFEQMPGKISAPSYVNFEKDIISSDLGNLTNLYVVENPVNDVFSLSLRFAAPKNQFKTLDIAANVMNFASTEDKSLDQIKKEFLILGCNYSFTYDNTYFTVEMQGIGKNFNKALDLMLSLLKNPQIEQSKMKMIADQVKGERKLENVDPSSVGGALFEYVRKGNKSSYIDRLSLKEIKKLKAEDLLAEVKNAMTGQLEIHLVASKPQIEELNKTFLPLSNMASREQRDVPFISIPEKYSENTVFFVNKKDAVQAQIYFYVPTTEYSYSKESIIDAFNEYFGGGFSGLVTQEIREYRSMAYSAGARYTIPPLNGVPTYLMGFIGTQADKTIEAITVFNGLLTDMPIKTDRLEILRSSLVQEAMSSKPFFRDLSKSVAYWKQKGFDKDPNEAKMNDYQELSFERLNDFYKQDIQGHPVVICVVGDAKTIDIEKLKSFGKFVQLEESQIYKK